MYILGISCYYHDSSAVLLKDGIIVSAAQEERFSRIKHDTSFPVQAINFCLQSQKINIEDIDYMTFYEKPLLKLERVLFEHKEKLQIRKILKKKLNYKKDVLFIESINLKTLILDQNLVAKQ